MSEKAGTNNNYSDADKWANKYGEYIESDPTVDFEGKNFVFTGLSWHAEERQHPIVLDVIARGGEYRSKVDIFILLLVPSHQGLFRGDQHRTFAYTTLRDERF